MRQTFPRVRRICMALGLALALGAIASAEVLLEDTFEVFDFGQTWQEHGDGTPDVIEVVFDGEFDVLSMRSDGIASEFRGIETATPISLVGMTTLTVDVRLRPLNAGVEGTVGAAELALIGSSGEFLRASAANNVGPDPDSEFDWADVFTDSMDNFEKAGPWAHCHDNCDSYRQFVITVDDTETVIQAIDDDEDVEIDYEFFFPDFTLATLGQELTIALRQETVEDGDAATGYFDSILVTGDATGLALLAGDADQDFDFDQLDLVKVQIAGKYLTGAAATWGDGDWDARRGAPREVRRRATGCSTSWTSSRL